MKTYGVQERFGTDAVIGLESAFYGKGVEIRYYDEPLNPNYGLLALCHNGYTEYIHRIHTDWYADKRTKDIRVRLFSQLGWHMLRVWDMGKMHA